VFTKKLIKKNINTFILQPNYLLIMIFLLFFIVTTIKQFSFIVHYSYEISFANNLLRNEIYATVHTRSGARVNCKVYASIQKHPGDLRAGKRKRTCVYLRADFAR